MKAKNTNFWNQLESKNISKNQVEEFLLAKLGKLTNQTQANLCQEFIKKVNAYYFQPQINNSATFSLYGYCQEIQAKQYKEGKRMGQTYYLLKLGEPQGETLKASQTDLSAEKWTQVEKSSLLGKKLVFKYRKWITNKELLDFYPQQKPSKTLSIAKLKKKLWLVASGTELPLDKSKRLEDLKSSDKAETG